MKIKKQTTWKQNNFVLFRTALRQLASFGLNPYEWQIDRSTLTRDGSFQVQHKLDEDFRIHGRVVTSRRNRGELRALQVVSL